MADSSESEKALEGLLGTSNGSLLLKPVIKTTLESSYPVIVAMYALLVVSGAVLNLGLLGLVLLRRLHHQNTMCLLANLALAHLVQCLAGIPITLTVMLVTNWVLGRFLCYFLPMLQDIPMHVSVLTFVIMAYDRYRFIEDPSKQRLPAVVFAIGTWLTASCIVVPYPIYTTYLHIEEYIPRSGDAQDSPDIAVCFANLGNNIHDYMRCIFVLMYVIPAIVAAYIHGQTSRMLKDKQTVTLVLYDTRAARSPRTSSASVHGYRRSVPMRNSLYVAPHAGTAELDLPKEERTQKYLVSMTSAFFVLVAPLNILRVIKSELNETYENTAHFDMAYSVLVWISFLPTCTMPLFVAAWVLSRSEKERVRGYFRFSNRRHTRGGVRAAQCSLPTSGGSATDGDGY
ncbi:neuropeptide Y receptor type 4-like, partial [Thrips palmi]|uniref:Neuropeptide Y receptor type 4-like n=1 Tax=Thrips palmi TaxID=161013 RepID=A0A6P8ZIQ5_THRPL